MEIKEIHYCAGSEECTPLCGPAVKWPIPTDAETLSPGAVVVINGTAWQKLQPQRGGWNSTDGRWRSDADMAARLDELPVAAIVWEP